MTDRVLTDIEMHRALEKGDERAQKIIAMPAESALLKAQFDQAVWAATRCLDNFDKSNYTNPQREKINPDLQKKILLSAFTAVQCVEVLQVDVLPEEKASDLQMTLLKAVTVYQTNGHDDSESLCAQRFICNYREGRSQTLPVTPPIHRAS
jgi:hypothetical protein